VIEIKGSVNTAKVFTDNIEDTAVEQIETLLNQLFVHGSKIRFMPDVHAGAGCVIGTTMTVTDKVCPNIVGVDVSCFTGDTKIPRSDGQPDIELSAIEGQDVWVYSMDIENRRIVPVKAYCRKTKSNAELVEVVLDSGDIIRCTPDHKFMLKDNMEYVEAKDLKLGQSLRSFVRHYDNDGYLHVNQPYGANKRHYPFHRFLMHYVLNQDIDGKVVHHVDGNPLNNTLDNLELMSFSEHSRHHRALEEVKTFQTEEFKLKRKRVLAEKGYYYHPKYREKIRQTRAKNIRTWMLNHPDEFNAVVKKNAERFKELAIRTNSSFYEQSKRQLRKLQKIASYILPNEITETSWSDARLHMYNGPYYETAVKRLTQFNMTWDDLLDETVWYDKITNNHKVISVTLLGHKEDVYCLYVPKYHNFAISAGVFVHNCGMLTVELGNIDIDFEKLDEVIHKYVPSGTMVHEGRIKRFDQLQNMHCYRQLRDTKRIQRSIGTLGGGNHFIEIDVDDENNKYLVIHTGSRNLGKQVAEYYQKLAYQILRGGDELIEKQNALIAEYKAQGRRKEIQAAIKELKQSFRYREASIPKDLAYLSGEYCQQYLDDMKICQEFATLNRITIAESILTNLLGRNLEDFEYFETRHNYIDLDEMLIRKGAVSAKQGEKLIIPINMRDGSLICIGKGNPEWNYSAPHGAGRIMSRKEAKEKISIDAYKDSMKGIYTSCVNEATIDESPFAYKSIDSIVNNIEETVEILAHIRPIYNFKAS
jgi:RNA-splicing ligase RtcB